MALSKEDLRAFEILEHAAEGNGIDEDELTVLWNTPATDKIAYAARAVAHDLSFRINDGIADLHGQIDMDATPCPRDCKFCSLAESNVGRKEKSMMGVDEIKRNVERYLELDVNLISFMVTGGYEFDHYIEVCEDALKMVPEGVTTLANLDDLTLEQAMKLKEIGFDSIYHVIHWGEGVITNIPKERRIETFENARKAGLAIFSGVEPIDPNATASEVYAAFQDLLKYAQPISACGLWRYPVDGSIFAQDKMKTQQEFAYLIALARLIVGKKVRFIGNFALNGDSGSSWSSAEVGMNPRDTLDRTEDGGAGKHLEQERKYFEDFGWEIRKGGTPLSNQGSL